MFRFSSSPAHQFVRSPAYQRNSPDNVLPPLIARIARAYKAVHGLRPYDLASAYDFTLWSPYNWFNTEVRRFRTQNRTVIRNVPLSEYNLNYSETSTVDQLTGIPSTTAFPPDPYFDSPELPPRHNWMTVPAGTNAFPFDGINADPVRGLTDFSIAGESDGPLQGEGGVTASLSDEQTPEPAYDACLAWANSFDLTPYNLDTVEPNGMTYYTYAKEFYPEKALRGTDFVLAGTDFSPYTGEFGFVGASPNLPFPQSGIRRPARGTVVGVSGWEYGPGPLLNFDVNVFRAEVRYPLSDPAPVRRCRLIERRWKAQFLSEYETVVLGDFAIARGSFLQIPVPAFSRDYRGIYISAQSLPL